MIKLLAFGFIFANALKLILFKISVFDGLADWRETKLSPKSSFSQNQNIFHFKPKIILKNSRALFHFYMRSKKYTVKNMQSNLCTTTTLVPQNCGRFWQVAVVQLKLKMGLQNGGRYSEEVVSSGLVVLAIKWETLLSE